jgi:two-component system, OmpR family, alkaline phosphatase synthesis response regulator PhoP
MNQSDFKENRILLVEDEETLAAGIEYNLTERGYEVVWAENGREALKLFAEGHFDLIILDIMLPFVDGFEVARRIRETTPQVPILVLTARAGLEDRVKGLEIGADDYLTKPFHLEELMARLKSLLRRKQWYQDAAEELPLFKFSDNEIDFRNLTAKTGQKKIILTYQEAAALKYLIQHKNQVVSREDLLEQVWDMSSKAQTRTVDNFIMRLRKYFEPDRRNPQYIRSVRGAGYMFVDK